MTRSGKLSDNAMFAQSAGRRISIRCKVSWNCCRGSSRLPGGGRSAGGGAAGEPTRRGGGAAKTEEDGGGRARAGRPRMGERGEPCGEVCGDVDGGSDAPRCAGGVPAFDCRCEAGAGACCCRCPPV